MTNALEAVGRRYSDVMTQGYEREEVIIGAPYLITKDWSDALVVIARTRTSHNRKAIYHGGNNWHATRLNPPVKVGDNIIALERGDGNTKPIRKDRTREVVEITDAGIMARYSIYDPILITHWVLWDTPAQDPVKDRHNPDRRKLVLDKLSSEGMGRLGDTGYATSAAEFFTHFDLPKPDVEPTAVLDLEKTFDYPSMPRDIRYGMDDVGISSLRKVTASGRAKVKLAKSQCRCKEITPEEATAAWQHTGSWKVVKVHKVECLWCTEIGRVNEVV